MPHKGKKPYPKDEKMEKGMPGKHMPMKEKGKKKGK